MKRAAALPPLAALLACVTARAAAAPWPAEIARAFDAAASAASASSSPAGARAAPGRALQAPPPTNFSWLGCLSPLAFPLPLGLTACDPGFFCPFILPPKEDPFNWSLPSICPPTIPCQLDRLGSSFCYPQGITEPWPCPPGSYCPDEKTLLPCPQGFYCPRLCSVPRPCAAAASCPPGSSKTLDYTGVIIAFCLDVLLALMVAINLRVWERLPAGCRERLPPTTTTARPQAEARRSKRPPAGPGARPALPAAAQTTQRRSRRRLQRRRPPTRRPCFASARSTGRQTTPVHTQHEREARTRRARRRAQPVGRREASRPTRARAAVDDGVQSLRALPFACAPRVPERRTRRRRAAAAARGARRAA